MGLLNLEKELIFNEFKNDYAYEFGRLIIQRIKEENLKPVRIRVTYDNDIVYQYLMDGKKGIEWLDRKENTVMYSKHSSLYVFENQDLYQDILKSDNYAICGGGFPLIVKGEVRGGFYVSGLDHEDDHRLIVDALKEIIDN